MEAFADEPGTVHTVNVPHDDDILVKVVGSIPRYTNGHQFSVPSASNHRSHSPKTSSKKPGFHRAFKQAVFQKRGKEDGSSNLRVTFTSSGNCKGGSVTKVTPVRSEHQEIRTFTKPPAPANIKPKSKPALSTYKDIVTIDKKKMQEEIESIPKPDHLIDAEKELLSYEGVKTFSMSFGDNKEYPCVGCLDIFPSQYALDDHLSRQSYQLLLDCPQCMRKCTFTNKCKMYEHLYTEHSLNRSQSNELASMYASLQVLPRSQIKLTGATARPANDVNGADESAEDKMADIEEVAIDGSDAAVMEVGDKEAELFDGPKVEKAGNGLSDAEAKQEAMDMPIIINGEDDPDSDEGDTSISCTECSKTFETEWTLQTHFSLASAESATAEPEICIPCRVQLVTPCSYKAHMRVHGLTEPFVCPDCGQQMYKKNVFLKHLRLRCLHYSMLSEFTCPGCAETFNLAADQLSHLKANASHLRFEGERSYYKCNGCPKAFKSVAAHSKHESCPGAGCTVVHMCNNCPQQTVFRSWTELTDHRSQAHPELVWKPKRSKMFGCYLCIHKSRTKQGLLDHLFKSHSKKKIDHMCQYCGVETDSHQALEKHKEVCAFKDEAKGRIKAPLAIVERVPRLSSSSDTSTTNNTAGAEPESAQSVPSSPPATQQAHENPSYLTHATSFNCHICTAQFSGYNKLRDHVTRRHEGRGLIYECWLCRDRGNTANFYRQSALDKHMIDTHKTQISNQPLVDTPDATPEADGSDGSDDEAPTKKMRVWDDEGQPYQCCRCEYSSAAVEEFKDHIKEHKLTADSHQCAECGMCFTVQLALRRHLYAVHKVPDYAKYSRTQYMAEYERQLHDTQGKCPVCKKQFDQEMQLRKHLRTHGMMYINTRRIVPS